MDYTVTKGTAEDYEDIIDLSNYIFGADFPSLLPKLYKNHKHKAQYQHILKEGHRIKALVGSFPLGLKICDHHLKMRGIGNVCVHKYSRGSGYMKLLMDNAIAEMKAEGCDMAVLGGQRQRYEYWGFTPCGISINVNFNSSNIRHTHIGVEDNYKFEEYDESKNIDLDRAVKLHDSQIAHAVREKDDFIDVCSSWSNRVIFVYQNGEFTGYLSTSADREKISEIVLIDSHKIDQIIVAYMKYFNTNKTSVVLSIHRSEEFMKLSKLCENYSFNSSCNTYIINYITVIKAFMDLKNTFSRLSEGTLIINVEKKGRYKIEVKDRTITVEETDMPYDISLSHLDASALLFSHSSFINAAYDCANPLVKAWFPLPLFYPGQDNV